MSERDPASTLPTPPVPAAYRRVWQRTVLDQPRLPRDTTTRVYWLQTAHWHGDIRVPHGRPPFDGVTGLQDCDSRRLRWLVAQQGFAGLTSVQAVADGTQRWERCQWHRRIDFGAATTRDIGRMVFDADGCDEWGVEAGYFERWRPLPGSEAPAWALGRGWTGAIDDGARREVLLRQGDWAMHLRERALPSARARAVRDATAGGEPVPDDLLRATADFEISLARRCDAGGFEIVLSTWPWREGADLALPVDEAAAARARWAPLPLNLPSEGEPDAA